MKNKNPSTENNEKSGKNKKNKKSKKIALIVILLIFVICTTLAILYFFTDILKTKKQMLAKNVTQIISNSGTENDNLSLYFEKKNNTPYENEGTFSSNIKTAEVPNEKSNSITIAFNGKNDGKQKQSMQNVEIQYSNDVKFPLSYIRDEDIYGLQTDYVSKKYIAIENNNLKQFAQKMGEADVSKNPDKIETSGKKYNKLKFSEEEKNHIKEKYLPIFDIIDNSQIQNVKKKERIETTINLTSSQAKEIFIELLKIFKDDGIMLNKVNGLLSEENQLDSSKFEDIISKLQSETINGDENIKININTEEDNLSQIKIKFRNKNLELLKTVQKGEETYKIQLNRIENGKENVISLMANFSKLQTEQVTEKYGINIQTTNKDNSTESYEYNFENTNTFQDKLDIERLTQENALILNEYPKEVLDPFTQSVTNRIIEVNEYQMQELGLKPEENPLVNSTIKPLTGLVKQIKDMQNSSSNNTN